MMTEERCSHGKDENIYPPIYWNPFNKVFQCHKCGAIFEEQEAAKGLVEAATVVSKGYKKWISIPDREKMPANVVLNMFAEECEKAISAYKARLGKQSLEGRSGNTNSD